jgi:hypothetical protein
MQNVLKITNRSLFRRKRQREWWEVYGRQQDSERCLADQLPGNRIMSVRNDTFVLLKMYGIFWKQQPKSYQEFVDYFAKHELEVLSSAKWCHMLSIGEKERLEMS